MWCHVMFLVELCIIRLLGSENHHGACEPLHLDALENLNGAAHTCQIGELFCGLSQRHVFE